MSESKKYNFFIDIDGTLLPRGVKQVSEKVLSALEYARSKGCNIFINTARSCANVPDYLKTLPTLDGICCGCGTAIIYGGKPIYTTFIPEKDLNMMLELFYNEEQLHGICFEGFEYMYILGDFSVGGPKKYITSKDDFETVFKGATIQKFATPANRPFPSEYLLSELRKKFDLYEYNYSPCYIEGVPKGYGKGHAIKLAEETLNLDHSLSVAIGDSLNDISMLEYAAIAVAVGNAPDNVKEKADLVVETSENDGVADAIYKLLN